MGVGKKFRLFLSCALLAWPPLLAAQFIGYVTSQSVSQNLFTTHTGTGISATITNLGQSSHFFTVCNSQFVGTVVVQSSKDGSFNPPNTVAAANYNISDSNCHVIQAGGYYPTMRVQITQSTTGSTSIFYSGIGGPVAPAPAAISTIGPTSPVACDETAGPSQLAASTSGVTLVTGLVGQSIIVCSITFSFDSSTTGGGPLGVMKFGSPAPTPSPLGGSCTLGTDFGNPMHTIDITNQTPQTLHFLGGAGGLFRLAAGQPLCLTVGPIGANTTVQVSFAQITF